jgi:hypothetical protein
MIYLSKVTKSAINSIKNRIVTAMGYNVISTVEVAPGGIDCPPVAGQLALYIETAKRNSPVFVGYVNKGLMAEPGERRIFAVDSSEAETVRVWLYGDKVEIGGTGAKGSNINHAVQWEALNTSMQNDIVTFINTQLGLIATGIAGGGGSYTPGTMSIDISAAKEDNILLP